MGSQTRMVAELQLRLTNEIDRTEESYWEATSLFELLHSLGDVMSDAYYEFTEGKPRDSRQRYVDGLRQILAETATTVDEIAQWLEIK